MPPLILHGFTISLVPHRFLLSMALLVFGTLAQAQIDSAYIITVERRVQAINAEKHYEVRTLVNDEFLAQRSATCLRLAFQIFAPEL
ncbi:MAG: hypothetical protein R2811_00140 [Flavobacteriales bacterium]